MNTNDNPNLMENLEKKDFIQSSEPIAEVPDNATLINTESEELIEQNIEQEELEETRVSKKEDNKQLLDSKEQEEHVIVDYEKLYESYDIKQLLEELEIIIKGDDVNSIKSKIGYIKVNFTKQVKAIKDKEQKEYIEKNGSIENIEYSTDKEETAFKELFAVYRAKKAEFDKSFEEQKLLNLAEKKAIIEDLKNLINNRETLKKTYDDFNILRSKWDEIGPVPQSELNDLWHQYNYCIEQFFDYVKINKELKELDLRKNLEQKIEIAEKVEKLLLEESFLVVAKELRSSIAYWKEIGPVPREKKQEIEDRFHIAIEKLSAKRKEHFEDTKQNEENNFNAKVALCEKVEELSELTYKNPKEWNEKTEQIFEIQKLWKSIGRANKLVNDEIWERFRKGIDKFFESKKDFFEGLKEVYVNNYNSKVNICVLAEGLKDNTNWKKTTEDLIRLQEDWKKIGPVDNKYSEKLWKRFRAACDVFFNNKSEYFKSINSIEKENYEKKLTLIKQLEEFQISEDNNSNLDQLKQIQNDWMNIGHIPIEHKDTLQSQFRSLINKHFDTLNASNKGSNESFYKMKMETLKETSSGQYKFNEEKVNISRKINTLKSDITLWENNIGFFVNSKGADKLIADFETKISKAKEELATLEDKLKILNKI
ncbi:MAG: hypothetical protein A2X12_11595 [Bacteroidetes bacterium GWE2_29_8]|nr:MAG: hypothetical protein A2X12_11595 [Bacteroidetes bacterium GWE2_29_8]OFY24386.1 MAG: hypothetical protein A2X02_08320 [Bacteroidetes bacterium GWF2_29_10]